MSVLLSIIAGLVIGGGLTGYWLSTRWRQQITAAETALAEIAAQHKQQGEENRAFKQQVADLTWQLNDSRNTLRYLESRLQSSDNRNNPPT
jgi:chromosome segregation ATPase